jgi:hypothetical protein
MRLYKPLVTMTISGMRLQVVGKISELMDRAQESVSKANSFTSTEIVQPTKVWYGSTPSGLSVWAFIPDTTLAPSPIGSQGS